MGATNLPKSWADVSLKQLIQIEEITNDKSLDKDFAPEYTRGLLKLSVFTGESLDYYEALPIKEGRALIQSISFLNEYPKETAVNKFKCGGYTWKVSCDVNNLSGGQVIDHYEFTKNQDKILANCNKLMAMYCTPYKYFRKVKLSDKEKGELLQDVPVQVVYPLTVFFCKVYPLFLKATTDYLEKATEDLKKEMETNQERATVAG